jgi:hypothetical protein
MISEPKVNGLSDTIKETDYCPKKFNRFLGEDRAIGGGQA